MTAIVGTSVGLFAGIGGIELGLQRAGFEPAMLCEIDPAARNVLTRRFPAARLRNDVANLRSFPACDVLAAGFPCQDLSQAGPTAGIHGRKSRLVRHVFDLLERRRIRAPWVLFENVPFLLQLDRGRAIRYLTGRLDELGYSWAYRIVDTRAFGLPQRRRRMFLLASKTEDPRNVLLVDDFDERPRLSTRAAGFYWTEGNAGTGYALDAVPPLKAGSSIGIMSPPAIWFASGFIGTPDIRDAERLQGFPSNWTDVDGVTVRDRWRLVGSAVSVPVTRWIGRRLANPGEYASSADPRLESRDKWPTSAWGINGKAHAASVSEWPANSNYQHLADFLKFDAAALSERATSGFYNRLRASTLATPPGFLSALRSHAARMRKLPVAA